MGVNRRNLRYARLLCLSLLRRLGASTCKKRSHQNRRFSRRCLLPAWYAPRNLFRFCHLERWQVVLRTHLCAVHRRDSYFAVGPDAISMIARITMQSNFKVNREPEWHGVSQLHINLTCSPIKLCASSYFLDSKIFLTLATPMQEAACYTSQQAVIERGSDAKTVERRGAVCRTLQNLGACFRKFLTAELPQSPQRDQAGKAIPKHPQKPQKPEAADSSEQALNPR
jgi:hypothetical protein